MLVPAGTVTKPALLSTERWRKASAAVPSSDTKPNFLSRLNQLTRAVPIIASPSPALKLRSGCLLAQVEVCGIELASLSEPVPVQHRDRAVSQGDQPITPEVLQGPVHMHGRETQRITEFRLGQRELIYITVRQPHGFEAHVQLAQEVGHPPVSLAPTQIEDPLAEHRPIDQGLAPERVANTRTAPDKIANGLVRDVHHLARGQRTEAVVHHVQMQALQVGNVAGDVKRENLALAFFGQLVAVGGSFQDQA